MTDDHGALQAKAIQQRRQARCQLRQRVLLIHRRGIARRGAQQVWSNGMIAG
jgi:hypothetical protein